MSSKRSLDLQNRARSVRCQTRWDATAAPALDYPETQTVAVEVSPPP
jgi:hypothetical protein